MVKLFVTSDIHSYFNELKTALDNAGFDENNEDHWLVVCGDCFDRGPDSVGVWKFLRALDRKVLIKGNHEQLLVQCCERGWPGSHDISNGTARTIYHLGYGEEFDEMCRYTLAKVGPFIDGMVNYLETKNYIFVHSWIPAISKDNLPAHYTRSRRFEFNPDWRNANQEDWDAATWGNPFDMADKGLNQTGKTIVFGHWCTEYKWSMDENRTQFDENSKHDIYYGDGYIGIDATTAYSGKVNVLVLEDDFLDG